ncbi:hypothetical protein [Labrys sp. 22185]|uniref:hypothetical protein n=1 Tax=Labrys sp. 22185 TaxID=3453888 RepID=UPI003F8605D6
MANTSERTNDPSKITHEPARPAVVRNVGSTESEKYLAHLGERSFLNLWSYPSPFIDKKADGKGDGKELCDLLVVCGDHVLIFSDKTIAWPDGNDEQLSWKRWYKRAIAKSADQIRGAERWINTYPNRIFLDRLCTQPLPVKIPPPSQRKVHGIVVALGAGEACKAFFDEGIGSLMIAPSIKGDAHWKTDSVLPFAIGDIDPTGSFIHVLDDASLDITLRELDTITDFTSYLAKKETLIRSGKLYVASGEEDLVAYYMTHMNVQGEHDFTKPDGSSLGPDDAIGLQPGFYEEFIHNPQYLAKKKADGNSYVWDRLIETFTTHMLAGTTIVPNGKSLELSEHERSVRQMALVPRHMRRMLGNALLEAMEKGTTTDRFTRAFLPGPTELDQSTGYFFMTLSPPKFELDGGYEQYRHVRRNMLEAYALVFLRRYPKLERIVGIATEPPGGRGKTGSSEDLIYVEVPEWTPEILADLEERKTAFEIAQPGNYTEYAIQGNEFPDVPVQREQKHYGNLNRKQRRAKRSEERRKSRK